MALDHYESTKNPRVEYYRKKLNTLMEKSDKFQKQENNFEPISDKNSFLKNSIPKHVSSQKQLRTADHFTNKEEKGLQIQKLPPKSPKPQIKKTEQTNRFLSSNRSDPKLLKKPSNVK